MYAVACGPRVWLQHPNRDRWQKKVFENFFQGALQSKGAYRIVEKATGDTIGSTRFYDYNQSEDLLLIGYTFYGVKYWGKDFNDSVKKMMLDYAFRCVWKVHFHIGADNTPSQIAIERLGAKKIQQKQVSYFGEASKLNYIYEITKQEWLRDL